MQTTPAFLFPLLAQKHNLVWNIIKTEGRVCVCVLWKIPSVQYRCILPPSVCVGLVVVHSFFWRSDSNHWGLWSLYSIELWTIFRVFLVFSLVHMFWNKQCIWDVCTIFSFAFFIMQTCHAVVLLLLRNRQLHLA